MHELLGNDYDIYDEQAESSGNVADPQMICIKKSTIYRGLSSSQADYF